MWSSCERSRASTGSQSRTSSGSPGRLRAAVADTTFINRVVEPHVRLWLGSQFPGHVFSERSVSVPGGSFKFDAVSGDGSIIGLILSSRAKTATGNENYGGWRKALNDIQWLKAASASRRLVVCTNDAFRALVMRRSARLGTGGIEFIFCQLPPDLDRQLNEHLDASSREQRTRPTL